MKRQVNNSYQIVFTDTGIALAFLRRRPGHRPYIAINREHATDLGVTLDCVIALTEADKTLTPVEMGQSCTIFITAQFNIGKSCDPYKGKFLSQIIFKESPTVFCQN